MVTIKDIAKEAGVAQGTVSNVLNGKGNVSSEKIKRVMQAAKNLGYVPNERAALLRRGISNSLAVIMPDSRFRQHEDFYFSFKSYAESRGYTVSRYMTKENRPIGEKEALEEIRPLLVKGIACISSVAGTPYEKQVYGNNPFLFDAALPSVVFVERQMKSGGDFMGFDYREAGKAMAEKAKKRGYPRVCLLTGNLRFSNEADFYQGFSQAMAGSTCRVIHIQTDSFRRYQNMMQIVNSSAPQAFFISNYGFAESVKDVCATFYDQGKRPELFTVSPLFTMPEHDFIKYEMNYRKLGKIAAEHLIELAEEKERTKTQSKRMILAGDGFRDWYFNLSVPKEPHPINILTLDSPEAYIMRNFSRLYTKKTGVKVNICIYSYEEIYEAFNTMDSSSEFDVLRLDTTWLSWFAQKLLLPLSDIDPQVGREFGKFLKGTLEHYAKVHGKIYTLPATPSVQMLYYRKDLFDSPIWRRMYYEQFKRELAPPKTFEEFNRIAQFFTKSVNPSSPVDYGATITLGSTGVAGSEYLARLFSHQDNLYDADRRIRLDSDTALLALKEIAALKQCTAPEYCSWWTNTAAQFATGNYAMSLLYSNYAGDLLSPSSKIAGKIGYTMVPGDNPVIGGGSLGIFRYSRQPEEALSFIKWICSEPVSSASTLLGSTSPCRKTYENYEVLQSFPWLNLARECFTLTRGNRIPPDAGLAFDERRFLSILGMAVKNTYSGITEPEEALRKAQERFERHFQTRF